MLRRWAIVRNDLWQPSWACACFSVREGVMWYVFPGVLVRTETGSEKSFVKRYYEWTQPWSFAIDVFFFLGRRAWGQFKSSAKRKRESNPFPAFMLRLQRARQLEPRNVSGFAYIIASWTTLLSCTTRRHISHCGHITLGTGRSWWFSLRPYYYSWRNSPNSVACETFNWRLMSVVPWTEILEIRDDVKYIYSVLSVIVDIYSHLSS